CLDMTPRLWHKISKSIVTSKKRILVSCFGTFLALMAINVIRWLGVNNDLLTLLSIVFAYTFFVFVSLFIPWSWFRKIAIPNKENKGIFKASYCAGTILDWLFSIILTLWYFGILVMFAVAVLTNVGS
ncbi:hypothetical protein, partial [Alteromonas mediterranea]|uniref:hypothetical protein n=1 Tax=Alteromonas mediterranea TaxID=314275 RepID=UPI002FE1F5C3